MEQIENNEEIWKKHPWWSLEVSTFGNVRTLERKGRSYRRRGAKQEKHRILPAHPLVPALGGPRSGYLKVCWWEQKTPHVEWVHRLVGETFLSHDENCTQINHLDFNGLNNHVDNLQWTTPQENMDHFWSFWRSEK